MAGFSSDHVTWRLIQESSLPRAGAVSSSRLFFLPLCQNCNHRDHPQMHNEFNSISVSRGQGWGRERKKFLTQEAESLFESGVGLGEICKKKKVLWRKKWVTTMWGGSIFNVNVHISWLKYGYLHHAVAF